MGFANGDAFKTAFFSPQSVCADPSRPGSYFIGEISSVRYYNGSDKTVSLIAGSSSAAPFGDADGAGAAARFNSVGGLLCTSDGQTLFLSDGQNGRLKSIDIKANCESKAICGAKATVMQASTDGVGLAAFMRAPRGMCFDRTAKSESIIFLSTGTGVRRFDRETSTCVRKSSCALLAACCLVLTKWSVIVDAGELTTPKLNRSLGGLTGMACSSAGYLIVSSGPRNCVYTICISSGEVTQIAGGFSFPQGLALNERDRIVYVADSEANQIRTVSLSDRLFR